MLVKDIMSTRVEAVRPATTIGECARKMEQLGVGALVSSRPRGDASGTSSTHSPPVALPSWSRLITWTKPNTVIEPH